MTPRKFKTAIALAVAGVATVVILRLQSNSRQRDENAGLREQLAQAGQPGPARSGSAQPPPELNGASHNREGLDRTASSQSPSPELLRLRGEVGVLKNQAAEVAKTEQQKQIIQVKLHSARQLCTAIAFFALDHQDQFPTNFDAVASDLASAGMEPGKLTNQFEIVYQGTHEVLHPENIIVSRLVETNNSR